LKTGLPSELDEEVARGDEGENDPVAGVFSIAFHTDALIFTILGLTMNGGRWVTVY